MNWKIPLFKIYWDQNDIKAAEKVIRSGFGWAIGPNVVRFEESLAKFIGVRYVLVFNSGTSALHSLMLAYGFGLGDEIIVPSFTFIATANAPLFVGAKPIFAEIEGETLGLDPSDVEKKINKKTKAILPIHYGGCPCNIIELKKIAKKHNLILIEDAAESLGAKIGNKNIGTFGDSAVLSFCQNKIITTGEGGAVVTNSKDIYEKLKLIRSHGRQDRGNYFSSTGYMNYISLGYNFRMSDILAALGFSQLKKIGKIIKRRRANAEYFSRQLADVKEITLPKVSRDYLNVYQMYTIKVDDGKEKRDDLREYLNKKGIMAKVYFDPVHLTGFYRNTFGHKEGDLPITEKISNQVLTLPMYPDLTKKEINTMVNEITSFFKKKYASR